MQYNTHICPPQISTKIKLYLLPKEKKNKFSNLIEKSSPFIFLFGLISRKTQNNTNHNPNV